MATYSTYTKATSSTNKSSTSIISSSSKTYMNKTSQFIGPSTRYIKNTLPISYQHNSLKTTSTITRCKPTSRYYTSTCAPSLAESNRLERNYSYIEAMKETKSLPSSSNSSSTSTIESPVNETLQPQVEEVEIPIQIKLVENQSTLAKSRSQSSIFHLFRNTFSPFQIRKWRSKSRDKLLYNSTLNQTNPNDRTFNDESKSKPTQISSIRPDPHKSEFVLPINSRIDQDQKDNNYSYTSSLSSNSSDSSYNKASPKLSPSTNERQLSYLKLTCLLNGYDKNEIKEDKVDSGSVKSIYLKSSKALSGERYYDVKPGFRRYTSSPRETKKCDDDGQMYKSELSVRLNLDEKALENTTEPCVELASKIEPIAEQESVSDTKASEESTQKQVDPAESDLGSKNSTHDGHYYIGLLKESTYKINELCAEFQPYIDETNQSFVLNEDVQGQIQTAIGKGQLLINQKFKQFRGLCEKNISAKNDSLPLKEGEFVTRDEDLAGFWDMVYLQVEDINKMFEKLSELRKNNWISETKPVVKAAPKKKISTASKTTETAASKARAEAARQRIQEMKKKAALAKSQKTEEQNAQIIN